MSMRLHGLGSEQKRCIMALSAGPRTDGSIKPGWRARVRYGFDNLMSRGTPALVGLLGLASVALVPVVSSVAWFLAPADVQDNGNWLGVLWRSLLRTMDPGTMGGDEGSPVYLLLMFMVTLGGIFIVSALIGVLTTGLDARIAILSKGRSGERQRAPAVCGHPGRHRSDRDGGTDPPPAG